MVTHVSPTANSVVGSVASHWTIRHPAMSHDCLRTGPPMRTLLSLVHDLGNDRGRLHFRISPRPNLERQERGEHHRHRHDQADDHPHDAPLFTVGHQLPVVHPKITSPNAATCSTESALAASKSVYSGRRMNRVHSSASFWPTLSR